LERQPKSVLCLPILNQGHLIGILYLKNRSTSGVFTSDRILILNFLCTQAAISLENARLYNQQQEKTREIAQKETEYRSIFESVNDGLSICDLETGKIIASNPAYRLIHGYTQEELILLTPSDFIHPDDIYLFSEYLEALRAGNNFYTQCIGKHKDGSYFDAEVRAVPFIYKGKSHALTILRDITEQQAILRERKKAEKTVIKKSQELERALQELKQAQLQMVQNEKMATLGNLVAGVAHEVNNPIGFLKGSISNAEDYIKDIFGHLELYQENYPQASEEIEENAEDIDLEYLSEDLPKLLNSMRLATERITDISNSLRTFSRADTSDKVACNIHEGIDSTILILKYRLKANDKRPAIKIIKKYGNSPQIKCFLGQLNQVFMNIIANAIDAFDSASKGKAFAEIQANPHKMTIKTELISEENIVSISIKDNALGMPESVRERIFDNLFTTKGVGKGTGLGLAIAKQIVEETHNGKLSCNSTLGEGTEFLIELPIF
ncbi:MAG: ATP-binding protein, partial [Cyanobacteria bacterium P01_D01_bin.116]